MPRGDRTGPNGLGPMTGRGAGICSGYSMSGCTNFAGGRGGLGRFGSGRRRGFRNRYWASGIPAWALKTEGLNNSINPDAFTDFNREQEKEILKNQAEYFQNNLEAINQRLDELGKQEKENK